MSDLLAAIRGLPLFESADPDALARLAAAASPWAVSKGTVVCHQDEPADAMFVVIRGRLVASWTDAAGNTSVLRTLGPGDAIGEVPAIIGGRRTATVVADTASELVVVPRAGLDALIRVSPIVLSRLTTLVRRRQNRSQLAAILAEALGEVDDGLVEELDQRATVVRVRRGETALRQGDLGDAWFVVLNGRFRIHVDSATGTEARAEVGRGDTVGDVALMTGTRRAGSLVAVRDSELMRIPKADFEALSAKWPALMRFVALRLARQLAHKRRRDKKVGSRTTWTIVPASPGVDARGFAQGLAAAVGHGVARVLGVEALARLGLDGRRLTEDHPAWTRVDAWLDDDPEHADYLLLVADPEPTAWSRLAVGHAERVILVADAAADPRPGPTEAALLMEDAPAPTRLVLLHPPATDRPRGAEPWLQARTLHGHHHARVGHAGDLARIARTLSGHAVGLALGGGGARAWAHVGVLRALREHGVPIDAIGGAGVGALVAALYAAERLDAVRSLDAARAALADARLEDLWVPALSVCCDLTTATLVVDERGPAWDAIRAATATPGTNPPVERGASRLVDGGVIDNLPIELVRARCDGVVIGVHVSGAEGVVGTAHHPLQSLWRQVAGGPDPATTVLARALQAASAGRSALALRDADVRLRPPLQAFGWAEPPARIEEIVAVGYRSTVAQLEAEAELAALRA